MKMFEPKRYAHSWGSLLDKAGAFVLVLFVVPAALNAQGTNQANLAQKVAQLTDAVSHTEMQLEQTQRDLEELRRQLIELQREMGLNGAGPPTMAVGAPEQLTMTSTESPDSINAVLESMRERQAVLESEITTQEQTKVESESKYPVKVTGMLLMNGFKNTGAVDMPAIPSVAVGGQGSAGASVRQTMLGFDARGPHLFGARSFGDLRIDFFGSQAASSSTTSYSGDYSANSALMRLRTIHAGLEWDRTQLYFALDRPILSPDAPTSLTATALPALAWSGNLWTWNPQAVFTQNFSSPGSRSLQLQAALIDAGDAPLTPPVTSAANVTYVPPTSAEQSAKPGIEARVALVGAGSEDTRMHVGIGGYFAEHSGVLGWNYDSWASTLDARLPLVAHLELSGNIYRGAGLGGLGAGGYKDFVYSPNSNTGGYYFRVLDDVGGWAQLKEAATERLEFNAAYGTDNVFAGQLRPFYLPNGSMIQNLARNRTFTGNVIYSPSSSLLFSLEYRHLQSAPVEDDGAASNIFGIGAGYRF